MVSRLIVEGGARRRVAAALPDAAWVTRPFQCSQSRAARGGVHVSTNGRARHGRESSALCDLRRNSMRSLAVAGLAACTLFAGCALVGREPGGLVTSEHRVRLA